MNEERTPTCSWEHNPLYLTQKNELVIYLSGVPEDVNKEGKEPTIDLSDIPENVGEKEKEPEVDLSDLPEEASIEEEVTRIKNYVVSSLIQFDRVIWSCKACLYECSMPNRITDHILNRHFNGPLV